MSTAVPQEIRACIRLKIWKKADELDWTKISPVERAKWYENWSKDTEIGGVLAHFMDPRRVRLYIKDSLLKPYQHARLHGGLDSVLQSLGLPSDTTFVKIYRKPHGRLLNDSRIVCWGNSRDWKSVIFSVFERSYEISGSPYAAVLMETGNTCDPSVRRMISEASSRLGVYKVIWTEDTP